jgi:hypothetical protein
MLAAAGEVKLGRSVSIAAPIEYCVTADNPEPARHKMTLTCDSAPNDGLSFAMDQIGMNIHGNGDTHIDALSHVICDGRLYNNRPGRRGRPCLPPGRGSPAAVPTGPLGRG